MFKFGAQRLWSDFMGDVGHGSSGVLNHMKKAAEVAALMGGGIAATGGGGSGGLLTGNEGTTSALNSAGMMDYGQMGAGGTGGGSIANNAGYAQLLSKVLSSQGQGSQPATMQQSHLFDANPYPQQPQVPQGTYSPVSPGVNPYARGFMGGMYG